MKKLIGLPILALILCSCSFKPLTDKFNEVTAPDYVNSSKAEKLQLPPDLSEYETSDTYNVPGAATSYTDFENQKNRKIEKVELLNDPDGIKLVKSGNFRWLIVNKSPEKIWPHLEDFWYEQGFNMKKMNRRLGVMETEWTAAENIEEELSMLHYAPFFTNQIRVHLDNIYVTNKYKTYELFTRRIISINYQ